MYLFFKYPDYIFTNSNERIIGHVWTDLGEKVIAHPPRRRILEQRRPKCPIDSVP